MFIYNFKMNKRKILKILLIILTIIIIYMMIYGIIQIINIKNNNTVNLNDDVNKFSDIEEISSQNYTSVLKNTHNNIDTYIGNKIKFTGFVYRLYDFTDEQFVLGRQMIISSDYQAVVVGFLCHMCGINKYEDGSWITIEGTITKGDYHGEMPIIEIEKITSAKIPNDEYVYPPDDTYLHTISNI